MIPPSAPLLSIVIATRNRADSLAGLLRSLEVAQGAAADVEVVLIDNGSTDATGRLLTQWSAAGRGRHLLAVQRPGKSHALNCGIRLARGDLLAFTDDDVEVAPTWIRAMLDFCGQYAQYDAAMGRVLMPPHVTDPEVVRRVECYETLPFFDRGDAVTDLPEMYGCNMVLRRQTLTAVGGFDERLGPGASGFGDDTELSERICRAGMRIGYMPGAVVYHAVDVARLTPAFFREYHQRKARGDFAWAPERFAHKNVSRFLDASLRWAWCRLTGDAQRGMRARMRMIRNLEFLRLRWRARRARGGWRS
jgi:glycosyltransferase involved in cell wall biosynthesis